MSRPLTFFNLFKSDVSRPGQLTAYTAVEGASDCDVIRSRTRDCCDLNDDGSYSCLTIIHDCVAPMAHE